MRRDDGVVARLGQVLRRPIERHHEGGGVVYDHRLLVGQAELGIRSANFDTRFRERLASVLVVLRAILPGGIQHHLHFHAAPPRHDDRLQEVWVREDEHLDAK
jgi:hypothetical protein